MATEHRTRGVVELAGWLWHQKALVTTRVIQLWRARSQTSRTKLRERLVRAAQQVSAGRFLNALGAARNRYLGRDPRLDEDPLRSWEFCRAMRDLYEEHALPEGQKDRRMRGAPRSPPRIDIEAWREDVEALRETHARRLRKEAMHSPGLAGAVMAGVRGLAISRPVAVVQVVCDRLRLCQAARALWVWRANTVL